MDINDIKSTLEKLDPLKINDSAEINETYDKMKEELTRAGFLDVPTNVPESTVVHREGGLPTGAKLTPEEVAQMLKPNASIDEPISPDAATVKTTSTKRAAEIYDSFAPMVSPHFTTGMSHAQTMALANVVKEKLFSGFDGFGVLEDHDMKVDQLGLFIHFFGDTLDTENIRSF